MISNEDRCLYLKSPLAEVICQLRFPQILIIGTQVPADFQEAIRAEFPRYQKLQEKAPNGVVTVNHQFVSADGAWRVNMTQSFLSLSCARYAQWEDFAKKLDKPLAAFIRIYKPAYFERIGLRYLNFISRKALGLEGAPFRELIAPHFLGVLALESVREETTTRCSVDTELAIQGGCRAKIHAGPGTVKRNGQPDPELKFIFDQDLYMPGNVPVNLSAGALQTLHRQAFSLFRGAVTDLLHDSMEPQDL